MTTMPCLSETFKGADTLGHLSQSRLSLFLLIKATDSHDFLMITFCVAHEECASCVSGNEHQQQTKTCCLLLQKELSALRNRRNLVYNNLPGAPSTSLYKDATRPCKSITQAGKRCVWHTPPQTGLYEVLHEASMPHRVAVACLQPSIPDDPQIAATIQGLQPAERDCSLQV